MLSTNNFAIALFSNSISAVWHMAYDFAWTAILAFSGTCVDAFSFAARKMQRTISIICTCFLSSTFGKWMAAVTSFATTNGSMVGGCAIRICGANFVVAWIFTLTIFACQIVCTLWIAWASCTLYWKYSLDHYFERKLSFSHRFFP